MSLATTESAHRPRVLAGASALAAQAAGWAVAAGLALGDGRASLAAALAALGAATMTLAGVLSGAERRRRTEPIRALAEDVSALADGRPRPFDPPRSPELAELVAALDALHRRLAAIPRPPARAGADSHLTRSGMFEAPPAGPEVDADPSASGDFSTLDMVNRLEPQELRWLESSPAEQDFLGWPLSELRLKSFLEIIHPDDRNLAWEQFQAALIKGEAHGLVYRIKTARGEARAVEVNVGVRYGPDMKVTHLRCHVADVTAKVRAGRELRRRTKELTLVNEQLRRTNRELQELKDRYSDLYQNAPAMYFSLDARGEFVDCNNTLLRTLGYPRHELVGRPYTTLLPESRRARFAEKFAEFLREGSIELESRWRKVTGEEIDVWITGSAVRGPDGQVLHSRSVAQDITARRVLEAELQEKNARLARANAELQRKNRELDEFTYVVSHDLQEPLRTLIAFSDFLMRDHGEALDESGREFIRHLVEASRRMRALINDLLDLSRAGRVAGDFAPVDLEGLVERVRADLAELIRTRNARVVAVGPLPTLWGDRDRIGQLLANLVGNGLKYNRSDEPVVEVGAREAESPGWATLFVRDNGIGIEPQFHAKIFQIFRRLHPRDAYEGTGAGLAICQKIVQAHGGRIWVESEPGRGSTFYATLPSRAPEAPPARAG